MAHTSSIPYSFSDYWLLLPTPSEVLWWAVKNYMVRRTQSLERNSRAYILAASTSGVSYLAGSFLLFRY